MYAVEDVAEAAVVAELLARGVRHRQVHRLREQLAGRYPLATARLATAPGRRRARLLLREHEAVFELTPRGWQVSAEIGDAADVRLRLLPVGTGD